MMLGMLSVVPGLGEIAAAADMALYLYQGDYANAALAATMFLPGGAVLAFGLGAKGLREVATLARAGAHGFEDAMEGSRVIRGLERAGGAVKDVLSAAKTKVSGWVNDAKSFVRGGEKEIRDIGVVGETPNSRILGRNLERGGEVRPAESAAHHLVPGNEALTAPAKQHLEQNLSRLGAQQQPGSPPANIRFVTRAEHQLAHANDFANWTTGELLSRILP